MKIIPGYYLLLLSVLSACTNSQATKESGSYEPQAATGFVEVSGTKLNYVAEGKGKPCLVIGSSIYYPRTFSLNLRDSLRLYFTDMRWFAKDYAPVKPENFTLDTILNDIEKVRSALNLEKVIIMGHSIHSVIAFEYAKKYPGRVTEVVMIGSPAYQTNREQEEAINEIWKSASVEREKLQNENWKKLAEMKNLSPAQFVIENYCIMAPKYWYDMNYDGHWLWKDMTLNTDILNSLYESVFKDYFIFRNERRVPVPVFVAMGKYDFIDPPALWNGFDDIKGLTVRVFEKSGHTPQLEERDLFDSELLKWLRTGNLKTSE
ncbi:MAG: alpha/beta hydrolase [Bacteroidales bacterium]|nr:alpha/beta hydrolase [Bacteroidales bacterium]